MFEQVGDVVAGEGLELEGVVEGAAQLVGAVGVVEGHDFGDVLAGIEAALLKLAIVFFATRTQGIEAQQQLGLAGGAALIEQFLDVLGILEVLAAVVRAGVGGDEFLAMIDTEPIGKAFEQQALGGVETGHGVAVGIERHAKAVGGAHGADDAGIGGPRGKGRQVGLFRGKEFERHAVRCAVSAHIGHGIHPLAAGDVESIQMGRQLEAGQEVLLDVADAVFDPALFVAFAHSASAGFEAVVSREVQVAWVEDRAFAARMGEDGGFEVVVDEFLRHAAKELEGVLMAGQEVFGSLAEGKFHIEQPAMTEYHDKEGEPPGGGPDGHGTGVAPIDLCAFAGSEAESEEGWRAHRAHLAHIVLEDAHAAAVSVLGAQTLEDLSGAVRMVFEQALDDGLAGVELALARGAEPGPIALGQSPLGDRLGIELQFAGDLREAQAALAMEEADFAVKLVGDHGCLVPSLVAPAANILRKASLMDSVSAMRGAGSSARPTAGSRLKT